MLSPFWIVEFALTSHVWDKRWPRVRCFLIERGANRRIEESEVTLRCVDLWRGCRKQFLLGTSMGRPAAHRSGDRPLGKKRLRVQAEPFEDQDYSFQENGLQFLAHCSLGSQRCVM